MWTKYRYKLCADHVVYPTTRAVYIQIKPAELRILDCGSRTGHLPERISCISQNIPKSKILHWTPSLKSMKLLDWIHACCAVWPITKVPNIQIKPVRLKIQDYANQLGDLASKIGNILQNIRKSRIHRSSTILRRNLRTILRLGPRMTL
jgi:hypothetical protein